MVVVVGVVVVVVVVVGSGGAVVVVVGKDLLFQEFPVEGEEFKHYANEWWTRVGQYYKEKELQKIVDRNGF